MATITIDSAFIEDWTKNDPQHPAWGMKTAEPHSRKKEDGSGYETVGRTFRTVKVSRASGIDLTQFGKGQRVKVTGKEVTETREHEGKKYFDLIVWADSVELAQGSSGSTARTPQAAQDEPWAAQGAGAGPSVSDEWATPQAGAQQFAPFDDESPF